MTTEYDPDNDELDEELETPASKKENDLRNLRNKANKADKLEKENEQLRQGERELAYYRAGLTPQELSTPVGQMFAKAYDGELDPDTVKAAWAALGNVMQPEPSNEISESEQQSSRERQALATGAAGDTGTTPPKPVRGYDGTAVRAGKEALERGETRESALGELFSKLTGAAAEGDRTVTLPFGGGNPQE